MFNPKYVPLSTKDKHSKYVHSAPDQDAHLDYERLEYLGDMLIKFFVGIHFCILY